MPTTPAPASSLLEREPDCSSGKAMTTPFFPAALRAAIEYPDVTPIATIGAARVENFNPVAYRLARYRTAEGNVHLKLQGAYRWTQGDSSGLEWRDIPTVDLDQEPTND
jgi:hypothetical protein